MSKLYEFEMKTIDGSSKSLADYKGKPLLIVNVASQCGLTPQYRPLQELYEKYKDRGFAVLGFPSNNFGKQEPGTESEIKTFCESKFGVTFDMFSKISVKGSDIHPLYTYLTKESEQPGDIGWNFHKFLVDKEGKVVENIDPRTDPSTLESKVEALL